MQKPTGLRAGRNKERALTSNPQEVQQDGQLMGRRKLVRRVSIPERWRIKKVRPPEGWMSKLDTDTINMVIYNEKKEIPSIWQYTDTINMVIYNEKKELQGITDTAAFDILDISDIYDNKNTQHTDKDISSEDKKELDQGINITYTEWSTGGGRLLSLKEGDAQEEVGRQKRRRLSGRVEEIVLRMEGGVGEERLLPEPTQTEITLHSESRSGKGGGGGGRNVRQLVGRFGEQSKITTYFGGVGGGEQKVR